MRAMRTQKAYEREKRKTTKTSLATQCHMKHHNEKVAVRPDDLFKAEKEDSDASGRGGWKKWLPGAFLRCAFTPPATMDTANAAKFGGSHSYCRSVRMCAAEIIYENDTEKAKELQAAPHAIEIQQVQVDETHLTAQLNNGTANSKSILGSHGLLTTANDISDVCDMEQPCAPKGLADATAPTMWQGLQEAVPSKMVPGPGECKAQLRGLILASDHAASMGRMQTHAENLSRGIQYFIKALCKQHSVGLCMYPLSKLLDVTAPLFCIVKQLHSGTFDNLFWQAMFNEIWDRLELRKETDDWQWQPEPQHQEHARLVMEMCFFTRNLSTLPQDDAERIAADKEEKARRNSGEAVLEALPGDWRSTKIIHWNKACGCQTHYDAVFCVFTKVRKAWDHCFPIPALNRSQG